MLRWRSWRSSRLRSMQSCSGQCRKYRSLQFTQQSWLVWNEAWFHGVTHGRPDCRSWSSGTAMWNRSRIEKCRSLRFRASEWWCSDLKHIWYSHARDCIVLAVAVTFTHRARGRRSSSRRGSLVRIRLACAGCVRSRTLRGRTSDPRASRTRNTRSLTSRLQTNEVCSRENNVQVHMHLPSIAAEAITRIIFHMLLLRWRFKIHDFVQLILLIW